MVTNSQMASVSTGVHPKVWEKTFMKPLEYFGDKIMLRQLCGETCKSLKDILPFLQFLWKSFSYFMPPGNNC